MGALRFVVDDLGLQRIHLIPRARVLSNTIHLSISFGKSTPKQTRQLVVYYCSSKY